MVRKYASRLVILGLFLPRLAFALGLGELTLHSYLNEPLRADIDLLEMGGLDPGQIKIRLASREDFSRAGVERAHFLTSLTFTVATADDGVGYLKVSSDDPVREPFLDFLVEARWPNGRLLREYTILLDPPIFAGDDTGIISSVKLPAVSEAPTAEAATVTADTERYGASAALTPQEGVEYMVQRDDTMWSIARRSRPAGSTIQQTMLDIQRMNPEAFIGNNINQLKAGYVLRLPNSAQISEQQFEEAVAEVALQEQSWQDNVAAIDARQLDAPASEGASGRPDGEDGRLQIAAVDGEAASNGGEVSARMENVDRVERDNEDLQARVGSMQEQVDTLKRLVTLKDDQISALQSALSGAGAQTPDAALDLEEGTIEPIVEQLPDAVASTDGASTQPAVVEEIPPYVPPVPAADAGIMGLVMDYLLYIIGMVVLLIAGLAWRFKDRFKLKLSLPKVGRLAKQDQSKGSSDPDDEFAGVELVSDDSLIVDEFEDELIDDGGDADSLTNFSAPDEEAYAAQFETGDALAEADIYIAYGRFPQAVDLLKAAINVEPVNAEYRIKLMEACVEMVDSGEFQQQYADLQVIADEPALERARAMLDAVDGGEVWLDDLPDPTLTAEDVEAARVAAAAAAAAPEPEPEPEPEAAVESDEGEMEMPDLGLDAESEDSFDADLDAAGLDLELDDTALEDISDEGLDLDLELDADLGVEPEPESEPEAEAESAPEPDLDDGGLDMSEFDLEEEPDSGVVAGSDGGSDEIDIEDDFDLGELSVAASTDEPAVEESAEEEIVDLEQDDDLDLSEFNIADFDADSDAEAEPEEDTLASAHDELPELDLDDIASSLDSVAADEPEPEPALELAPEADGGMLGDFGDLEIESEEAEEELDLDELSASFGVEELDEEGSGDEPAEVEQGEPESFDLDELEAEAPQEPEQESAGEGLVFAADGDEIATKLDLARAYMDMGDHDGARSILEEVQLDGSDAQQQEAQSLLDSID